MATTESPRQHSNLRVDDASILAEARRLMIERGPSRVTLSDVARRAGVSRMTVYRRWSSLPELVSAVLHAEWTKLLDLDQERLCAAAEKQGARRTLVDAVVMTCATLRSSSLMKAMLTREPEVLVPYLFKRVGRIQQWGADVLGALIVAGQADGTIVDGNPAVMAAALMMTAQTFVVSVDGLGGGHPAAELDAQLAVLVDRYLRPEATTSEATTP